jgi:hypothetical protein
MPIRINAGTDSLLNKKIKVELKNIVQDGNGAVTSVLCRVLFFETDNTTVASGSNRFHKTLLETKEIVFNTEGRVIDSGSLLYTSLLDPTGSAVPRAIRVIDYISSFKQNSLPGVAGSDPIASGSQGILKVVVDILQANEEIPT